MHNLRKVREKGLSRGGGWGEGQRRPLDPLQARAHSKASWEFLHLVQGFRRGPECGEELEREPTLSHHLE